MGNVDNDGECSQDIYFDNLLRPMCFLFKINREFLACLLANKCMCNNDPTERKDVAQWLARKVKTSSSLIDALIDDSQGIYTGFMDSVNVLSCPRNREKSVIHRRLTNANRGLIRDRFLILQLTKHDDFICNEYWLIVFFPFPLRKSHVCWNNDCTSALIVYLSTKRDRS